MRTTTLLLTCVLTMTAAGCLGGDTEPSYSVNWFSLTPIHCENGHKPIHCGSGNLSSDTAAGTVSASFSIDGSPIADPYPLGGKTSITVTLSYQGPPGSADADVTIAIDDVGGVHMTSAKNVTKTLSVGQPQDVVFVMEPTPGWPDGDWVFPRTVLGIDDDEWVEGHLVLVMAAGQ